jgi:hypothetical protein
MLSNTKSLLIVSGLAELGVGVALLLAPSLTAQLLLGAGLSSPASVLLGRVAGAALLSIGLTCWLEQHQNPSRPSVGLVVGLATYNAAVLLLLISAGVVDGMNGLGIWPATGLHAVLLIWCGACLRAQHENTRART